MRTALNESQTAWNKAKLNKDVIQQRLLDNCIQEGLEFCGETPADGNCLFHAVSEQLNVQHQTDIGYIELRKTLSTFLLNNSKLKVYKYISVQNIINFGTTYLIFLTTLPILVTGISFITQCQTSYAIIIRITDPNSMDFDGGDINVIYM